MRIGGPYLVTFSYLGYTSEVVEGLNLKLGEKRTVDVILPEDGQTLDEVVVRGRKNSTINSDRTGAATQISTETL